MKESLFEKILKRRIAQMSVGASALRNQGGRGLIETSRNYFEEKVDLQVFFDVFDDENNFRKFLDQHTNSIVEMFPDGAKSWGAARKGLNLFLRDVCYNKYFADKYELPSGFKEINEKLKYLELPLDNDVIKGLSKSFSDLPKWEGIKHLIKSQSDEYQIKASELALQMGIARIQLDLLFWRANN